MTDESAFDAFDFHHLDGTLCVAGWYEQTGFCAEGGGPIVPRRRTEGNSPNVGPNFRQDLADRRDLADAARLLGPARMVLDACAEGRDYCRAEAADMAQRIVDLIGHPVTDEPPHALVERDELREEVSRLRHICQRLRAGWLPHRLAVGSWWWGRPTTDNGFRMWSVGLVPSMAVVEQMIPVEVETWTATLHPLASEQEVASRP